MSMIIVTTVLTVLYALGWHNQPARGKESNRRSGEEH